MRAPVHRRPDLPQWLRPVTQRLSPFVQWFVVVSTLAYLVYVLVPRARNFIVEHLAVGPGLAMGKLWQPVTALFVHVDVLQFLFNMIGLWFVGSAMEQALGRQRFLLVFFLPAVAGYLAQGLLGALLGHPYVAAGCGLSILSVFAVFGVHYGRTPTRILGGLVFPAQTLSLVLIGFSLFIAVASLAWPAVVGILVAVLLAFVLSGGPGVAIQPPRPRRPTRPRVQMHVIEGGKGKTDPRYLN